MKKLGFVKMVATGNDFVIVDFRRSSFVAPRSLSRLAHSICERREGVGADGLLVLEKSRKADFKMRIFNRDGTEAEMCGNGLRCAVLYAWEHQVNRAPADQSTRAPVYLKEMKVETKAGIYEAKLTGKNRVRIKMEEPKDLKSNFGIEVNGRPIKVNYIDTGVPHAVIFVQGLDEIDVEAIGKSMRYHKEFKPRGTNVDFVEIIDDKNIRMRTYERGVEGETLACGTGAVASAIVTNYEQQIPNPHWDTKNPNAGLGFELGFEITVHARGGILKVYFTNTGKKIKDVYLEGEVKEICKGEVSYV